MSQVAERRRVRTHRGPGGWLVTAIECTDGVARVGTMGAITDVVVADCSCHGELDPDCFTAAACTPEGEVLVVTRQSPPALLVTRDEKRTAPTAPLEQELIRMTGDDRLLILSPALLEAMPEVLARSLHATTADLLTAEPTRLLGEIFENVGAGSGVIISRESSLDPTGGPR